MCFSGRIAREDGTGDGPDRSTGSRGESATDLPTGTVDLAPAEVRRRLPAVDRIDDETIRTATVAVIAESPAYFWTAPADAGHPARRRARGLWLQTLTAAEAVEQLGASLVAQGRLDDRDLDRARAAVLLRDQRARGPPDSPAQTVVEDHGLRMAAVVREADGLDRPVARAVAEHAGPRGPGPAPTSLLSDLVHAADAMASAARITVRPRDLPPELGGRVRSPVAVE